MNIETEGTGSSTPHRKPWAAQGVQQLWSHDEDRCARPGVAYPAIRTANQMPQSG